MRVISGSTTINYPIFTLIIRMNYTRNLERVSG
jgi:hypothetical protein